MNSIPGPIAARTAIALGALALSAAAANAEVDPDKVWPDGTYTTDDPVLSADLPGNSAFTGVLDPAANRLCYIVNAAGLGEAPTAAHIHKGAVGETGGVVVPLKTPQGGSAGGCVSVDPALAKALVADPGGYYVNIHTAGHPAGAQRGQLKVDAG